MKDVFDFFQNFTEKEITLKELSEKTDNDQIILQTLFSDYNNYKHRDDFTLQFYVNKKFFDKNGNIREPTIEDRLSIFSNEGEKPIPYSITNIYHLDENRSFDIFIAKHIYGFIPTMGEIEDDDFNRAAWIIYPNQQIEVPFYTKNLTEQLFRHFSHFKWKISYINSNYIIEIETKTNEKYTENSHSLNIAIAKILKSYIKKTNEKRYLIHSKPINSNNYYGYMPEESEFNSHEEAKDRIKKLSLIKKQHSYKILEFQPDGVFICKEKIDFPSTD